MGYMMSLEYENLLKRNWPWYCLECWRGELHQRVCRTRYSSIAAELISNEMLFHSWITESAKDVSCVNNYDRFPHIGCVLNLVDMQASYPMMWRADPTLWMFCLTSVLKISPMVWLHLCDVNVNTTCPKWLFKWASFSHSFTIGVVGFGVKIKLQILI